MVAERVSWSGIRKIGSRLTTPLHPDDYLSLINPLWTARELRGRIEQVIPETDDAATIVIRPGWGWSYNHKPGQYVGIGIQVKGKFHWRSYSVSSPPKRDGRTIAITVRAMPEGFLSTHLVKGLEPGTIIRLAEPNGDFVLPEPPPKKMLCLVAGSGITPVMAMLRTLDRRDTMPDVMVVYSSPTKERMIFRDEIVKLSEKHDGLNLHEQYTDADGMLEMKDLEKICPDWKERETWACGPGPMLDAAEEFWEDAGLEDSLHLERFSLERGRHHHLPQLQQDHRCRRRHVADGGRRGGRHRDAVRLSDGHLPHLHAHARRGEGARHAQRRGDLRPQRTHPDLHHRSSR